MRLHVLAMVCAMATVLLALQSRAHGHEGAGGDVGVGVGVGLPTALTVEVAPTPRTGLEFALGLPAVSFDDRLYAHLVYKVDLGVLARGPSAIMPVYLGGGGFMRDRNGNADLGARIPLGLAVNFVRVPVQVFAELALEAIVVSDLNTPPLTLGGAAGARVWF